MKAKPQPRVKSNTPPKVAPKLSSPSFRPPVENVTPELNSPELREHYRRVNPGVLDNPSAFASDAPPPQIPENSLVQSRLDYPKPGQGFSITNPLQLRVQPRAEPDLPAISSEENYALRLKMARQIVKEPQQWSVGEQRPNPLRLSPESQPEVNEKSAITNTDVGANTDTTVVDTKSKKTIPNEEREKQFQPEEKESQLAQIVCSSRACLCHSIQSCYNMALDAFKRYDPDLAGSLIRSAVLLSGGRSQASNAVLELQNLIDTIILNDGYLTAQQVAEAIAYNESQGFDEAIIREIQNTVWIKNPNGVFDWRTVQDISWWQIKHGLEVDGKVGPETLRAMKINPGLASGDSYELKEMEGKAFVKGEGDRNAVAPNDVIQGKLSSCYFSTAMAAVARANPDIIKSLITENGDGTYNVRLFVEGEYKNIRVKSIFPVQEDRVTPAYGGFGDTSKNGQPELWAMIIEKAYATYRGGYSEIEFGHRGRAVEILTGISPNVRKLTTDNFPNNKVIAEFVKKALVDKHPVTTGTYNTRKPEHQHLDQGMRALKIIPNHAYSVENVSISNLTIDLQNPLGAAKNHLRSLALSDLRKYFKDVTVNQK